MAAGRRPVIDGLALEKAGIEADPRGIKVANTLLTTNKKVFAIGDVTGACSSPIWPIIRRASSFAALVQTARQGHHQCRALGHLYRPELAQVGMTEADAQKAGETIRILRFPYAENDRAISERHKNGFIKVITDKKGRILGATIVGLNAGEIIQMWTFAITQKMKIKAMTEFISPYPTLSEISKRAAYTYFTSSLTSPMMHRIIRWIGKLG